jgi:hypothetical protein
MKELPKKETPQVSGGAVPSPWDSPSPDPSADFPQYPGGPVPIPGPTDTNVA